MHTAALLAGCGLVHSEVSGLLIGVLNNSAVTRDQSSKRLEELPWGLAVEV